MALPDNTRAALRTLIDAAIAASGLHLAAWTPEITKGGGLQLDGGASRRITYKGQAGGPVDTGKYRTEIVYAVAVEHDQDGGYSRLDTFEDALRKALYTQLLGAYANVAVEESEDGELIDAHLQARMFVSVATYRSRS